MELASRQKRLAAAALDLVLAFVPAALSVMESLPAPVRDLFAFGLVALGVAQVVLLARRGQTLGKIWLGLRIVDAESEENAGFVANVLLRGFLGGLLNLNPLYFFVDSLLIFRKSRRCLHDYIADTVVIES